MTHFPDTPFDGEQVIESTGEGAIRVWTYSQPKNEWTYEDYVTAAADQVVYTDQVMDRQGTTTQSQINVASAATASATQQNVDEIQGTKSKGTWQFMGGVVPDDNVPPENQFWLTDADGDRTQEFCEAAFVRIHALGNQNSKTRDRVVLGAAQVGDRLIIQDLGDRDGCSYTITSVEEHEPVDGDYTKAYAVYGVEADPVYCIGSVAPAEIVAIKLKSGSLEGGGDFLPLSGGTITGALNVDGNLKAFHATTFDCPTMVHWKAASSNSYPFSVWGGDKWAFRVGWDGVVKSFGEFIIDQPSGTAFRIKKDHIDKVKIEHGGRIFCAYDLNLDDDNRTVTTKGWVKEQLSNAAGSGAGFITEYDGNRFYKPGTTDTTLSEGEVMFLTNGSSTAMFAGVNQVALPEAGIDWDKFTHTGTIEVRNGGTVCGRLQVVSATHNPGKNWVINVKNLDVQSNDLDPESGHPCYFRGMFFG